MPSVTRRSFLALGAGAVAWAACGGPTRSRTSSTPSTLSLIRATVEVGVGDRRLAFALFDGQRPFTPEGVSLRLEPPGRDPVTVDPLIESLGRESHAGTDEGAEAHSIFVAEHRFDVPGRWTMTATFRRSGRTQGARDVFEVVADSATAMVGEPAIASETPTIADGKGVNPICTRTPACSMHAMTVTQAVRSGRPSLLIFATPRFCTSRTCGPAIDVIEKARPAVEGRVNFVHVEIYTDTSADKKHTQGVTDWKIPGEPWVAFVGADGVVRDRWSGAVGEKEIARALPRLADGTL